MVEVNLLLCHNALLLSGAGTACHGVGHRWRRGDFPNGMVRDDMPPDHKAVRQAVDDCLANSGFNAPGPVAISFCPERLVIENPGGIKPGLARMLRGGISDPRSFMIMRMFHLPKFGERLGREVPSIMQAWSSMNLKAPEHAENATRQGQSSPSVLKATAQG